MNQPNTSPRLLDFLGVSLMAVACALTAAGVHSAYVIHRGYWLYQAEIGGGWFRDRSLSFARACNWTAVTEVALLSALILMPLRRRAVARWVVWACCVVAWTAWMFKIATVIKRL